MLGQDAIAYYKECSSHVVRYSIYLWYIGGFNCYEYFLSSYGVGASRVFTFLVRSHVRYGKYLSYLAISSSRLALSATS